MASIPEQLIDSRARLSVINIALKNLNAIHKQLGAELRSRRLGRKQLLIDIINCDAQLEKAEKTIREG